MELGRLQIKKFIWPFVSLLLVVYFLFHAFTGDRGILATAELKLELAQAEERLEQVRSDRIEIQDKVGRLKGENIDLDFLEERARQKLDYVRPGEMIVYLNQGNLEDMSK